MRTREELIAEALALPQVLDYKYEGYAYTAIEDDLQLDISSLELTDDEEDNYASDIYVAVDEFLLGIDKLANTISIQEEIIVALRHTLEDALNDDEFEDYISSEVGVGDDDGSEYDKAKSKIVSQLINDYKEFN